MKNYIIEDDRDQTEADYTHGFVVATDKFMSGWGNAPGKSYVAMPFFSPEHMDSIENRFNLRSEFLRVRVVAKTWRPKLRAGDHLYIYAGKAFNYPL
jgi:hypothetical protein